MRDTPTIVVLILLTLASVAASAVGLRRLGQPRRHARLHTALVAVLGVGAVALFAWNWAFVTRSWQPITAHVDGLLLIAALLALWVGYLLTQPRMIALAAFITPLLVLVFAWAVCAALWTYHPFHTDTLEPAWQALHLAGVYLGTVAAAVAAAAGGVYLELQRRIKAKRDVAELKLFSSLETLEAVVQRAAALGFALLTLGLISGLVIALEAPGVLGPNWYTSPKVLLATLAWAVFAVVMNLRFATSFRGSRAAALAIGGFALLLATYGIVTALDDDPPATPAAAPGATDTPPPASVSTPEPGPVSVSRPGPGSASVSGSVFHAAVTIPATRSCTPCDS